VTTTPSQDVELPETSQLIDGVWSPATVDLGIDLENPNTGEKVARMKGSTDEDVERAAAAAWRVHESDAWRGVPVEERAAIRDAILNQPQIVATG